MALTKMEVFGYRGFAKPATVTFAVPNRAAGSGLTVITGPNNAGKSSVVECLQMRNPEGASFDIGVRNAAADKVAIRFLVNEQWEVLASIAKGSSEASMDRCESKQAIWMVPSRRAFEPYFGRGHWSRKQYLRTRTAPRSLQLNGFSNRLFNIQNDPSRFNQLLEAALGYLPTWTIDRDRGQYFLKFYSGSLVHSSDGIGEGIISIFAILDALYESEEGDVIAIDEPELSLHPALQRRLFRILAKYAATRQVIVATHSPYFVDSASIANGGHLVRVTRSDETSSIHQLSEEGRNAFQKLSSPNLNNPHVLGLNACELFFQEDQLVVTEGQEDVMLYPKVADQSGIKFAGSFFGWGAGGADNVRHVYTILRDLGFRHVAGLLDKGREELMRQLAQSFPNYYFGCIPASDIRSKPARSASPAVCGLLDEDYVLRPELVDATSQLLKSVNAYLEQDKATATQGA